MSNKNKIFWLANPRSPHIRHWDEIINTMDCNIDIQIISIWHRNGLESIKFKRIKSINILPEYFKFFPEVFQYLLLGLFIRSRRTNNGDVIHAHGTSGYGLAAFISGYRYGVTTYGSEIFNACSKGFIYKLLINRILICSTAITSASPKMTQELMESFNVKSKKIHEFSLGISNVFYFNKDEGRFIRKKLGIKEEPVWILNRRVKPLYHTLELAKSFVRIRKMTQKGHLLIMEGDSESGYFSEVESFCQSYDFITLIHGFISQEEMRAYLSAADFSVSIPDTDQLSSSILEGALCNAVPLLRDLQSYKHVKTFSINFHMDIYKEQCFDEIFLTSFAIYQEGSNEKLVKKMQIEINRFKMASTFPYVEAFYKSLELGSI